MDWHRVLGLASDRLAVRAYLPERLPEVEAEQTKQLAKSELEETLEA